MNIEDEWNKIAEKRLLDRLNGNDTSYNNVLLPVICNNIYKYKEQTKTILDFGCGTGELTYEISKIGINTIGLDISKNSICLAKKYFINDNLHFTDKSIFEFNINTIDLIVANMSLMDTEFVYENFSTLYNKLEVGGIILITITHPAFWPIYWNYCNDNFDYLKEQKITKTYKTSNTTFDGFETSHYHRPISYYLKLFSNFNLKIIETLELRNPNDTTWYPRFLYFELKK
ncbi:class I SAM-dependent methyltransferase [Chryseobacterium ginsengisoli]|uniref:Class I SAM-dependent methyltransferase n=1 Tax=Chryseobacterium ginsengisoli TaxID=363853 RepID=A0ABP9N0L4_9FLAO